MAQDGGDPVAHQVEQEPQLLLLAQATEPAQQRSGVVSGAGGGTPGSDPYEAAVQGVEFSGARLGAQPGQVEAAEDRGGVAAFAGAGRVEEGQALLGVHAGNAHAQVAGDVGVVQVSGQVAVLRPVPPDHGQGRQSFSSTAPGEGVQEGVGGGVVGLPGVPEGAGDGGEENERRQVQLPRQLMQIHSRIHLRPQHPPQPLPVQRPHQTVVQHPGRMHHTRQPTLRRNTTQHPRQRPTIRHITRHHLNRHRTQRPQLPHQLRSTRRIRTPPTRQQQMPHPPLPHQMPRHQPTQHPRTTRNQHRPPRIPDRATVAAVDGCGAGQARHQHSALTHRHLRLIGSDRARHRRRQHRGRRRTTIHVHQHEPPRILRLRRPHQTPHRRVHQVRHVLVATGADRVAGDQHEA
ncbi:hypothetical protein Saso_77310 [Streptomyces asoensis]|uniref:Uncharacterized protein n=1 Tax=Streptomyces asoensis TaxID=249586 RepID=A0ABQ3SD67_9ACTN|nr:hypothetical protein Saso_77310 [Streptomyces asoensis]